MAANKISGWVIFGLIFSILSVLALVFSGYGYQWEWWDLSTAFTYFLPGSVILALAGVSSGVIYWFARRRAMAAGGSKGAWAAIILSLTVICVMGYWMFRASHYPPIHDITTDTKDPPAFGKIAVLRADAPNDISYGGEETAKQQHQHYPEIETLILDEAYDKAFDRALKAAKKQNWEKIVSVSKETGRIEAFDKIPWFGFIDDVVIRICPAAQPGRSKIDIRSVSRVGKGDLGVNAGRIQNYLDTVRNLK